ncbi:chromate efflux transporter [Fulvimarina endophytica]|uniref:Chromate efflux transporter n=1 Tax=Fulvimarina endophytica TaxID=2293836 RepID=A0A371X0R5_9HYPH|nr:chromate efflux transporter [Fulvimarina endophytica]RFC62799.1 chromate efflux transporter [Fulvimarina endophytica]
MVGFSGQDEDGRSSGPRTIAETSAGATAVEAPDHGEIFRAFLVLGLTAFGGPIAHLAYFREAFVVRRRWLTDRAYADLVALCQFLPGPASSQVGFAIGFSRGGLLGACLAWTAFTIPSALALMLFALGAGLASDGIGAEIIGGLKVAAVAVVAHALLGMARNLTPDPKRAGIAVLAIAILAWMPGAFGQVTAICAGVVLGLAILPGVAVQPEAPAISTTISRSLAAICLTVFLVLLLAGPILAGIDPLGEFLAGIYRAGALVFGGGHVVLPLLEAETVATGFVSKEAFLAGYGAAQAVPGPLFTFAAFLGTTADGPSWGALALIAVFMPGMLLLIGILPFWSAISSSAKARTALSGANAAVVGILAAALYDPVFTSAILDLQAFALAALLFVMLTVWKLPPVLVVGVAACAGPFLLA